MSIDWNKVDYFTEKEFSEDPNVYAEPFLIYSLDKFRELLKAPIYPSPVPGALARFDKGAEYSRHFAVERKSTAIDIFCKIPIFQAWSIAIQSNLWGGIGVYFDTYYCNKPWCMLHLDQRKTDSLWFRSNKKYFGSNKKGFWATFGMNFSNQLDKWTY